MRILLILRGNYFCGQKQWIIDNKLTPYTIDIEDLRFLAGGYKMLANGFKSLDYRNKNDIFKTLFEFLTLRMQKGEFCVVNAPNADNTTLKDYKDLADKYRYKFFVLNFTQPNLDDIKVRNLSFARHSGIFVPEENLEAIDKALAAEKLGKKYPTLAPNDWRECLYEPRDLNKYQKIHHIGDIQGCYTVLKKALSKLKKDEFYIFLGDYIDRGAENDKVIKFIDKFKDAPNVVLLEGNHERHLIKWANGEESSSREFNENTLHDFRKGKLSREFAKKLYPHFRECLCYEFDGKIVLCTHGGLNFLPQNLAEIAFIPSDTLIWGVGGYDDTAQVAAQFCEKTSENTYQIFGHRNRQKLPVQIATRVFLCEGKVDAGGHLRIVSLSRKGFECKEFRNSVVRR